MDPKLELLSKEKILQEEKESPAFSLNNANKK